MGWYRYRKSHAFHSFRSYSSKSDGYSVSASNSAKFPGFPSFLSFFQRLGLGFQMGTTRFHCKPRTGSGANKFYFLDWYFAEHCKRRRRRQLVRDPKAISFVVYVGSGLCVTVKFCKLETIPYSMRRRLVLLSNCMEELVEEFKYKQIKDEFEGKILPATHPESVRVRLIAENIIEVLKCEKAWTDHMADNRIDYEISKGLRNSGGKVRARAYASHLKGLNWEFLVVNEPVVNASCLPGGRIVVFTGLLDFLRKDEEIATVIGHEVGHAVARHSEEKITAIVLLLMLGRIRLAGTSTIPFMKFPFSQRMEIEADYIGLLLMASAGYDPRVAPRVYQKLGKLIDDSRSSSTLGDYLSTHPCERKRAQLLAQAQVMEKALALYRETRPGLGFRGFLLVILICSFLAFWRQ